MLAKREVENWFKAAAASLAGVGGLPDDLTVPADPEGGRGYTMVSDRQPPGLPDGGGDDQVLGERTDEFFRLSGAAPADDGHPTGLRS